MADNEISIDITETVTKVEVTEDVTTINISPVTNTVEVRGISIANSSNAIAMGYSGQDNDLGNGGSVHDALNHINVHGLNKNEDQIINGDLTVVNNHTLYFTDGNYTALDLRSNDMIVGGITASGTVDAPLYKGTLEGPTVLKASKTGETTLARGDVVYRSGYASEKPVVDKADASDSAKMPAIGIVSAITNNDVDVITFGPAPGIDVSNDSVGDIFYVSDTTAGATASSPPSDGDHFIQKIGVLESREPTNSSSIVTPSAGTTVQNLYVSSFTNSNNQITIVVSYLADNASTSGISFNVTFDKNVLTFDSVSNVFTGATTSGTLNSSEDSILFGWTSIGATFPGSTSANLATITFNKTDAAIGDDTTIGIERVSSDARYTYLSHPQTIKKLFKGSASHVGKLKVINTDQELEKSNTTVPYGHTLNFTSIQGQAVYDALNLANNNIAGVNRITFADVGPNEGLRWSNIRIYESTDDLSDSNNNVAGNFQVVYKQSDNTYARRLTVRDTGIDVVGTTTSTAFSGPLTGNVTGQVSDISNHDTGDLTEGANLYYTDARADARISNAIKDEDNMGSNSATHVPSQQSVKAYVDAEVAGLVNGAPDDLNTLHELADALAEDANFSTTVTTSIGNKLAKASNLSDLTDAGTARTNLGLGTAATIDFDGEYSSLNNKPTLYSDSAVDTHLNQSTAANNEVLSWNGTDYDWVAQSGGIALTSLSVNATEGTAQGDGGIAYDNTTGVFTYTPPDLSSYITSIPSITNLTGYDENNTTAFLRQDGTFATPAYIANTFRPVQVDTDGDNTNNNALDANETLVLKKGSNVTLAEADGIVTISSENTTYSASDFTVTDLSGFTENATTAFLRQDGTFATPAYTTNTFRTVKVDTDGDGTVDETLGATEELVLKAGSNVTLAEADGVVTISSVSDTNTFRPIQVDTDGDNTNNNALEASETLVLKKGSNITLAEADGVVTINATNSPDLTQSGNTLHADNMPDDISVSSVSLDTGTNDWKVSVDANNKLEVHYGSSKVFEIDSSGNVKAKGDIQAFTVFS